VKRGLVEWDRRELSPEALEARLSQLRSLLAERDLDAAVCYTSVAQPVLVRYLTQFLPYWNEGVLVVPRDGEPLLLVALTNRVVPWIKGSSNLTEVRASRDLGGDAARWLAGRAARRVAVADRRSFPYRALAALESELGPGAVVELPELASSLRLAADADERRLRAQARRLALRAMDDLGEGVAGRSDHQIAGQADRTLRLAGAEDTLILVGPAGTWPGLPCGAPLGERAHVVVQVEYKGHWVQLGRTLGAKDAATGWQARLASLCAPGRPVSEALAEARGRDGVELYLWGAGLGHPFRALDETEIIAPGDIVGALAFSPTTRDLYGETYAVEAQGASVV